MCASHPRPLGTTAACRVPRLQWCTGLQIDQALSFQRRFGQVQRVAWWLLALVPVAAIAGLFGDGLFGEATAGSKRAGGTVTYERFGRRTADTEPGSPVRPSLPHDGCCDQPQAPRPVRHV